MSAYLVDQVESTENISVLLDTEVTAVRGGDHLESIATRNHRTGETGTTPADALFIFIGAIPCSQLSGDLLDRSGEGFILTGPDLLQHGRRPKRWRLQRDPFLLETSVPGVFAAGDVRYGTVRRVASAVGQGAVAVNLVHKYLESV